MSKEELLSYCVHVMTEWTYIKGKKVAVKPDARYPAIVDMCRDYLRVSRAYSEAEIMMSVANLI